MICTETGEGVNTAVSFAKRYQHTSRRGRGRRAVRENPPDIVFQGMVEDGWVDRYDCICATDSPFVIYWNSRGKTLEGLSFVAHK